MQNVRTLVLVSVEPTLCVRFEVIVRFALAIKDMLEIHLPDAIDHLVSLWSRK